MTRRSSLVLTLAGANHNPIAHLNGDTLKRVVELRATGGETVRLSGAGSSDPDGNDLRFTWFVYREAGTYGGGDVSLGNIEGGETSFVAPAVDKPRTVHVILQLEDTGTPSLFSYRRAVGTIEPR
jgi:hypothetical protein